MVKVQTQRCPRCKEYSVVEMTEDQWEQWSDPDPRQRPFIQELFSDWSADQRELLLTGYHTECWDADFKSLEEDEEV